MELLEELVIAIIMGYIIIGTVMFITLMVENFGERPLTDALLDNGLKSFLWAAPFYDLINLTYEHGCVWLKSSQECLQNMKT